MFLRHFFSLIATVTFHFALSADSIALLGGIDGSAYAAFVDPNTNTAGPIISNLPTQTGSKIKGVTLNHVGQAMIGGVSTFPVTTPYVVFVDPLTNTPGPLIANLPPTGSNNFIDAVGLNDSGLAIITGNYDPNSYAAFIPAHTNTAGPSITGLPIGSIYVGAINNFNQTLIGSASGSVAYAAFVDYNTNAVGPTITNIPPGLNSGIQGVAINNVSQTIIGGSDGTSAYAAFVDPNTNAAGAPINNLPLAAGSFIGSPDPNVPGNGVAINDSGQVIIGGYNGTSAYSAFIDLNTNTAGPPVLNLPSAAGSVIYSVAINELGQGLIGGTNGTSAYAAFVDPYTNTASNPIFGLPTTPGSIIYSVAFTVFTSQLIPTDNLTGNNKIFADYINRYAPQDAFYFWPSVLNGTLAQALESAAPTRNAVALFTANNNLFALNKSLSIHLRHHPHVIPRSTHDAMAFFDDESFSEDELFAFNDSEGDSLFPFYFEDDFEEEDFEEEDFLSANASEEQMIVYEEYADAEPHRPWSLWLETIGSLSSQKSQHQTAGFNPYTGGVILGLDKHTNPHCQLGGGAAYTFTRIDENRHSGHSDIHQEYLFAYASWIGNRFYFDGALWGGLFQIHHERHIHFSGWDFFATSDPNGWQASPHAEFGYEYKIRTRWFQDSAQSSGWIINPFVMADWVNAWQGSYQERGNDPFNADQKSHYSSFLRTEAGLRVSELLQFDSWRLLFGEAVSYVNKAPFKVGNVNAFLVGSPGSFTVETLNDVENLAAIELSTTFEPVNLAYPYGSLTYYGEINPSFQSHQLILELSWNF